MRGLFSRWFEANDKPKPIMRAQRHAQLKLEKLEDREVPAVLLVTSLADVLNGPGELRTQCGLAASGDTVEFAPGLSGGTVDLVNGVINIASSITVESTPGAGLVAIDGQGASTIFTVNAANLSFYITSLELENGNTGGNGGAINTTANSDNVFVTSSLITGCKAAGDGGGIYAQNSLTMVSTSVIHCSAGNHGGGIFMNGASTIGSSTISYDASGTSGAGIWTSNYLGITQSTLAHDASGTSGGGIRCVGSAASVTVVNCTFYKDTCDGGGGAVSIIGYGTDSLVNDTIVQNSAVSGGGVAMTLYGATNNLTLYGYLTNDILADNYAATDFNAYGTMRLINCDVDNNGGINYLGGSVGNITVQPALGPLRNNGGLSYTMMPNPGSPVINAGTNMAVPNVDERGVPRPQGGAWDIGAVEVRGYGISIVSGNFQSTPENQLFPLPLVVLVSSPDLGVAPNIAIQWTILVAANGATGFPQTPLSVVTNAQGEAELILKADSETGIFKVEATATIPVDFPGKQTVFFTLQIVDSAHTLEFAQQPNAIIAGQPQTVTILGLNSQDKVALNFNGPKYPVILELINSQGQVVQNLGTVDANQGVVTFNDIVLNTVGTGYQFKAIATELYGIGNVSYIDSIPFDVDPAQPFIGRRT
jgi:hypothetical protein